MIEGDAEAPDVDVGRVGEHFFAESFGAAVERAVVGAEGEVGGVGFAEAGAVGAGAGVDAAGGDVAPRNAGFGAGLGDEAGEDAVAEEALGLVEFAGVDVGFARVTGGVDEELGFVAEEGGAEDGRVGVIDVGAAQIAKRDALAGEQRLISLADVTGTSEQVNHRGTQERGAVTGEQGFFPGEGARPLDGRVAELPARTRVGKKRHARVGVAVGTEGKLRAGRPASG